MAFAVEVRNLSKIYRVGDRAVPALRDVTFHVPQGRFVTLMGPSGCGKTTLLNLLAGLEPHTSGEIFLFGEPLHAMDDDRRTRMRRESLGFVFQFFHLLPAFSALENVELPLLLAGTPRREAWERARRMLEKTGLGDRLRHLPAQLSGGEQQRTALARALVHRPRLVLADEPTGNLDSASGAAVLDLLRRLAAEGEASVIMATHSREAADVGDTVVLLRDGRVTGVYPVRREPRRETQPRVDAGGKTFTTEDTENRKEGGKVDMP